MDVQPENKTEEKSSPKQETTEKGSAKLTVTSKVKETIKQHNMNCASDFTDALDREVENLIKRAVSRAQTNDRKTVRAGDV